MTDVTALADQARAAGEKLAAEHGAGLDTPMQRLLAVFGAIAWLEGRDAGGAEAAAIMRRTLQELR